MPALIVKIGADSSNFNEELAKSVITAREWAKQVQKNVQTPYASSVTMGDAKKILASTGSATEKLHVSGRGLQHLFHMLGVEGSGSIGLLVHALASPLFLAISAAAGALWLFNKALQALSGISDTLGVKSLAPQMEHFREKTIEARAAVLEWADGLRRGRSEADALNDSLRSLTNTTEAWASADEKVADAQKGLDLAKIKQLVSSGQITPEEGHTRSNAVETSFDQNKLKRANAARNAVTHATVEAAESAEAGAAAARGRVPGLNDAYLDAQGKADANAERIKNAQENLKTLAKARADSKAKHGYVTGNIYQAENINQGVLGSATEAQPGLLAGAHGAKSELEKAEKDAEKLRDEAAAKRRDADMRMTKSAAEYKADKDIAAIKAQTREIDSRPVHKREREHANIEGFTLNSQQKIGAYAATPPEFKKMADGILRIVQNTDNLRPTSFNPVGSTPAQFGPGGGRR